MRTSISLAAIQNATKRRLELGSKEVSKTGDIIEVGVDLLIDNPHQPRASYKNIESLADNIRDLGQIQPITITKAPEGKYYVVAGHRRTRAIRMAGIMVAKAILVEDMTDDQLRNIAMAENLHRDQLSPAEISLHIKQIQKDFPNIQKKQIAVMLGISQSSVSNYIKTSSLSSNVLERMESHGIGRDVLIILSKITNDELLKKTVQFIEKNPLASVKEVSLMAQEDNRKGYKITVKSTSCTVFYGTSLTLGEQSIVEDEIKKAMRRSKVRIKNERIEVKT